MINKKRLDFLVILLTSMFVIAASAAVYNYMYIEASSINVETPYIKFVSGTDATSVIGDNGTYAVITSMKGWPNATRIYEDALRIQNLDNDPHSFELIFDSWNGDISYILYIYVKIFDTPGGTQQNSTLSVTGQNSTGTVTIPATTIYYVQWEIRWNATALSTHKVDVTLKMKVP